MHHLKSVSSRRLWVNKFYGKSVLWDESYFIASGGAVTVSVLKQYVEQQDFPSEERGVSCR
ncbi:transposase [Thermosynechococcus sp. Uc]|uniref:transposase n=1 Tax=Thermosynechococcus sp. Uc TaxID=3034853 RepID=UPI00345BB61B